MAAERARWPDHPIVVDEKAAAAAMEKPTTGEEEVVATPPAAPFPAKFLDQSTSGLKFDVKEGANPIDIALTE